MACAVKDSDTLRFAVGDRVQCRVDNRWSAGEVLRVRPPPLRAQLRPPSLG